MNANQTTLPSRWTTSGAFGISRGAVGMAFVFLIVGLHLLQLVWGASFTVTALSIAICLIGAAPIFVYGIQHIVSILFLFLTLYLAGGAVIVLTLVGMPIDQNLFVPKLSYTIAFWGILAATIGALTVSPFIGGLRGWVPTPVSHHALRSVANCAAVVSVASIPLKMTGGIGSSVGVFLANYIVLAFIAETARACVMSGGYRTWSPRSLVFAAAIVVLTIASNSKSGFFLLGLSYTATILIFRSRISWKFWAGAALAAIVVGNVVAPAINMSRAMRDYGTVSQIFVETTSNMAGLLMRDPELVARLEAYDNIERTQHAHQYDVKYFRNLPRVFERFILVPYIDAVVRGVNPDGPFAGWDFISSQTTNWLPSVISSGKSLAYSGNLIVVDLGLWSEDFNGYPTITIFAEAYYAAGLIGVFAISMVVFMSLSFFLSLGAGRVAFSIFAAYVIARYMHFLSVQTLGGELFFLMRQLPFDILLFYLACRYAARATNATLPPGIQTK